MGKKQKIKKETWLVFYRDKNDVLDSMEVNINIPREYAPKTCAGMAKDFKNFELDSHKKPIVKKLVYV